MPSPIVVSVHSSSGHTFSKPAQEFIRLIEGIGVEGDAHAGATVQHLYFKKRDPQRPNLRQVHLMHAELFDDLAEKRFRVAPGELGENITTRGIDLLHLPEGTELMIGEAVLRVTGVRNPCSQIDAFHQGLLKEMIVDKKAKQFLSGVMSVVVRGGIVRAGDAIAVKFPEGEHRPLRPV